MNSSLTLRKMQESDLGEVVDIHLVAFQGFFLTSLGYNFLYQFYDAILYDPGGVCYVCEHKQKIQGFVVGTLEPSNFYRRLITKRWWRFGLACIKPTLKHPKIIPRLIRAIHIPDEVSQNVDYGTLFSIAVLPEMQGNGIGKSLVKAFLRESSHRGKKYINLTTDELDNEGVNQFYINIGFRCARTFVTPEGRKMNEYEINL
jgi:ribosomal protein S18 acetylase RimI-like enzyme